VAFDWLTFTLEIVNFLVLVWILKRFLYQPVLQTIARRKAGIEQSLEDAAARTQTAETLAAHYRDRLAEWEQEKQALRTQAAAEVDAERTRRMAALQDALDTETERQRAVTAREAEDQRRQLEYAATAQGARFAARLLERLATPELEGRLIALVLEDLAQLPAARRQALRDACRDGPGPVLVSSGFALPGTDREALLGALAQGLPAPPAAEFAVDPRLLAGVRVEIGPWVLQANLRDELAHFAEDAHRGP
jgi:F-type H+-transporting ATPase subunit b